jgi:hypothetical protein
MEISPGSSEVEQEYHISLSLSSRNQAEVVPARLKKDRAEKQNAVDRYKMNYEERTSLLA